MHLSAAGRTMVLGRDTGDWMFPYDQTMSGQHAEVAAEDADVRGCSTTAAATASPLAVRGERRCKPGQRVLVGDQMLRVESV